MRPEEKPENVRHSCSKQHGFALVSAIFLLVILAALGAFMMRFSTVQQATSAQDINGTRAYQAARAGVEWGTFQALRNDACAATTSLPALPGTLAGFAVNVQCTRITQGEGGTAVTFFRIVSTASAGGAVGNANYVERQLQALVEK